MAAKLVSSVSTILQLRGCSSRYFLTVFLDSPTLTASTMRSLPANSRLILSTKGASTAQKLHHVVQNSKRTTFPLIEALENFSPSVVVALKRGAGSLGFVARPCLVRAWSYATEKRATSNMMRRRDPRRRIRRGIITTLLYPLEVTSCQQESCSGKPGCHSPSSQSHFLKMPRTVAVESRCSTKLLARRRRAGRWPQLA